ncbi:hypothetical protein ZHAS_00003047 [Anopheles sinensis]|uniref:Uncharacterized protein n=1 Tax=Anopheles sinensis TaxID=74873 RepID=A0A084VDI8_ANOSI|nr:hypothetical protein ZHAS_00003047 [Anopheles sinensis]
MERTSSEQANERTGKRVAQADGPLCPIVNVSSSSTTQPRVVGSAEPARRGRGWWRDGEIVHKPRAEAYQSSSRVAMVARESDVARVHKRRGFERRDTTAKTVSFRRVVARLCSWQHYHCGHEGRRSGDTGAVAVLPTPSSSASPAPLCPGVQGASSSSSATQKESTREPERVS